jgi:hypothetical protein
MRTVFQTASITQALAVKTALLAEGIAATISGEHSIGTVGGGVAVHVPAAAAPAVVRRVIEELQRREATSRGK